MLVIDKSGKIINANPAAAIFYGWTVEELKMMRTDQISMSSIESVIDNINQTNISEAKRLSGIHKRADGSSRDVEIKINTIVIDGKELLYAIINDITERKQAEEALRKSGIISVLSISAKIGMPITIELIRTICNSVLDSE